MYSVNADRAYRIKCNNKCLQVLAVLYICFYILRKHSCFGFTAKRTDFYTEFFMSGDIDFNHSVNDVARFLNASLCRALIPIRTGVTVCVHMLLDFIRLGKNSEVRSLMPFLSAALLAAFFAQTFGYFLKAIR